MPVITLSTDFGLKDGNVGVMRGVIWGIAPQASLTDLSHLIEPQNILEGALILERSAPYFPDGTIHIMVVDPGVGTARRPIAARIANQYFVGPDNGLLTGWLERAEQRGDPVEIVHLDRPEYWLLEVSHVFHGRDIFAPVAAHLATGIPLNRMGTPINDQVRLEIPRAQRRRYGWQASVIYIDSFGNLVINLRREDLPQTSEVAVHIKDHEITGLVDTFGERPAGDLITLFGSTGSLIISVVNGSAAQRLNARVGDEVEVVLSDR